jgi:hypothetical protein
MNLDALAARIRALHSVVIDAEKSSASARAEAGRLLIEAKGYVSPGGWLRFLQTIPIPDRTARDFMKSAKHGQVAPQAQPKVGKSAKPSSVPPIAIARIDRSCRAGASERRAAVREALIKDPGRTGDSLIAAFHVSGQVVSDERASLVKEAAIPFIKARVRNNNPQWQLPPMYLLKTVGILDTFRIYALDMTNKMPAEARAKLMLPTTPQEQAARDGIIDAIQGIRKVLGQLEDDILGTQNVVRAENRFRS